jgi:predicted acylesterase/phospholipase RssA
MPVTLGVRLSLSFPILLSAVPLHVLPADGAGEPRTHWMSDGGITSNFPIQLFDEWLPDHPTFGLDLLPAQGHRTGVLLSPDPQPVRWMETANLIDFLSQLLDASRNWRDTMQAELADSRDRICHIYLSKDEGGLNLRMGPGVSGRLIERGKQAGRQFTVERRFDWDRHRRGRWLTLMRMMQRGLERAGASLPGYRPLLAGDAAAATVTQDLVGMSAEVSAVPLFARTPEPPAPVMRIDPDV